MRNNLPTSLAMAVALFSSVGAAQAQASDLSYAGVGCHVDDDAVVAFDRFQGSLQNLDNTAHEVFCPIIRDHASAGIIAVRVTVVNQNANDTVRCVLIARERDGTNVGSVSRTTAIAQPAAQDLDTGPLAAPAGGYYTLRCSVPATAAAGTSSIVSYRVQQ